MSNFTPVITRLHVSRIRQSLQDTLNVIDKEREDAHDEGLHNYEAYLNELHNPLVTAICGIERIELRQEDAV